MQLMSISLFNCINNICLAKVPVSNLEVVHLLRSLQPVLQEAVQQRRLKGVWEITYTVSGPLTWRQFHRLAGRGKEHLHFIFLEHFFMYLALDYRVLYIVWPTKKIIY